MTRTPIRTHAERRSPLRAVRASLLPAAVLLVGLCAATVLTGFLQLRPVLSGSMEPELATGGVVLAQRVDADDLRVGDVLLFERPGGSQHVVHRIHTLQRTPQGPVITTKGDANDAPDDWTLQLPREDAYVVRGDVPYLGHAALLFDRVDSSAMTIGLGTVCLLAAIVIAVRPTRRRTQPSPRGPELVPADAAVALPGLFDEQDRQATAPTATVLPAALPAARSWPSARVDQSWPQEPAAPRERSWQPRASRSPQTAPLPLVDATHPATRYVTSGLVPSTAGAGSRSVVSAF